MIDAAPACTTNADCTDPDAPFCRNSSTCGPCASNEECGAVDPAAGLCAPSGACVACVTNSDCLEDTAPTCDGTSHTCRTCAARSDCDSRICNEEDGSCILVDNIYYVDDDATCGSGDGSLTSPFCDIVEGMTAFAASPRAYLHVGSGSYLFPPITAEMNPIYDGETDAVLVPAMLGGDCITMEFATTVLFRGFSIQDCGAGLALLGAGKIVVMAGTSFIGNDRAVQCSASTCRIYDATISGGDFGVRCESGANCEIYTSTISNTMHQGIGAVGGADLLVDGTTVSGAGANGVMSQDANLTMVRSTVTGSGGTGSGVVPAIQCSGGTCSVRRSRVADNTGAGISISGVTDFVVENNAVLANGSSSPGLAQNGGVVLGAASGTQIFAHNTVYGNRAGPSEIAGVRCAMTTIANSIVWGNDGADVTFGGCYVTDSDVEDTAIAGTGNISQDPLFTSLMPGMIDIHLTAGSPCVDAAPPMTGVDDDIDGDSRPSGTNADMGADELP